MNNKRYDQHEILRIIEEIETSKKDHPEQVQFVLQEAVLSLNRAFIFADYIDSYLSGDIDETGLYRILFVELGKLEQGSDDK